MKNALKKISPFILLAVLITAVSGCNDNYSKVVDSGYFKSTYDEPEQQQNKVELIQLKNGVVVYKNSEKSDAPSDYKEHKVNPASSDVEFGPRDIQFAPKDINPKKR